MRDATRFALAATALACAASSAFAAASYEVVELPLAGDNASTIRSSANGISDKGVVSVTVTHGNHHRNYRDRAQVCSSKRAKCKLIASSQSDSHPREDAALDVNAPGQVVGYTNVDGQTVGFLRDADGTMRLIAPFAENLPAAAWGLNDAGVVVGFGFIDERRDRGFVWKEGVTTWLPTLGGDLTSEARDVNASGRVAGAAATAGGGQPVHAFVYDIATGVMTDMGTVEGGDRSVAEAINGAGDIAGESSIGGQCPGCLFAMHNVGGVMRSIGALPGDDHSNALGINDAGEVVGISVSPAITFRGFIYTQAKGLRDLNDLLSDTDRAAYDVQTANDINNAGDIAGTAKRHSDGKVVAIKLVHIR